MIIVVCGKLVKRHVQEYSDLLGVQTIVYQE